MDNRMTPDQRAQVLADYKAKKYTTATDLAKAHGVSRSAIYRLLRTEPETPAKAEAPSEPSSKNVIVSPPDDFFYKTDKFADDLGLPKDPPALRHDVVEKTPLERADEAELMEHAFDNIVGGPADADIPDGILAGIYAEEEPVRETRIRRPRYDEPSLDRRVIEQRILFNADHFEPHLRGIIGSSKDAFAQSLAGKSPDELKNLLDLMERTRSVANLTSGFKQFFYIASQATEAGTRFIGMRTHGFVEQLKTQDDEITMCLKEIAINEWERLKALDSPQIRLSMLVALTLVQTDARNRMGEHLNRVVEAPVNTDVAEANKDL